MASQDVRYYLNGLLVEYKGGEVNAVATDGHRLALATTSLDKTSSIDGERQILPRKAVLELSKILRQENEEIKITFGNSSLSIQDKNLDFSTKLIGICLYNKLSITVILLYPEKYNNSTNLEPM